MKTLAIFLAFAATAAAAYAQCRSCSGGSCAVEPAAPIEPEWRFSPSQPDQLSLFRGSQQLGAWSLDGGYYRAIEGDRWGPKAFEAPVPIPTQFQRTNFGLERSQLHEHGLSISGRPASMSEVGAALEDDSGKLWLVLTGPGREKVIADLKADPKYAAFLAKCRVWSVSEKHPSLFDRATREPLGFPIGSPGVFLGRPDGTQLYTATTYAGPADLEALRKKDPDAPRPDEPKKPEPKKPDEPDVHPADDQLFPACCLTTVVVIGAWMFAQQRKKETPK